ncbi:MAG: hypothetical protein DWQ37_10790 [Planctomycetota bacterium]|nr:MAG: hypothetical protein DWQ37_10790 [Planctomycetota bacterium]
MKERRKRIVKRLILEELEERAMLANTAMQASAITTGSVQDIYFATVGNEGGGVAGIGMEDQPLPTAAAYVPQFGNIWLGPANPADPTGYGADSGLGQLTRTTGANTLGISSFASPTAGPSRSGGTGNPNLGRPLSLAAEAVDEAIQQFNAEQEARIANRPEGPAATEVDEETEPRVDDDARGDASEADRPVAPAR